MRWLGIKTFKPLNSYLPSIYNFIHSQEEPLHVLKQSPPLNIFSTEKQQSTHVKLNFLDIRERFVEKVLYNE